MAIRFLLDTNTVSFHIRRSSPALQRRIRRTPAAQVGLSVVTDNLGEFRRVRGLRCQDWTT